MFMKKMAVLMILTTFFSCVGISEIPAAAKLPGMIAPVVSAAELSAEEDIWNGDVDYSWYDGQESPYTISTAAQFAAFGNILNKLDGRDDRFAGKTIRLAADLDMDGKPFRAMGGHVDGGAFEGTFDGQGHIISNLNITQAGLNNEYVALFSRLSNGAVIRNLGLEGVTLDVSDAKKQAALAGIIAFGRDNTVENCFVRNVDIKLTLPLVQYDGRAGGLVADVSNYSDGNSTRITNCYAVNVGFSPREGTSGDLGMGVGHFAGLSLGGTFTNCYSGGVTEKPSDSTLPNKVMSFGIFKGVTDSNCYSDCYADDSGLNWQFEYDGYKRGGSTVSTDDLKTMSGAVSALSEQFYICDIKGYNSGYPILLWEVLRFKEPPIKLSVEKKTGNSVMFDAIDGAEFSANGRDWQSDREFRDLPPGVYVFRAKRDSESTELTVTIGGIEVWDGSADYSWYGDGSASTYTISTPAQFAAFGNILNKVGTYADTFKGKTIQLDADLDMGNMPFRAMGGTDVTNNWEGGYLQILQDNAFKGTFDGQGHIISNLNITQLGINSDCAALFVCVKDGGAVRNLGLEGVTVNVPEAKSQAALAGRLIGDTGVATIENCFVRDVELVINDTNDGKRIGGFVAEVSEWPQPPYYHNITNCYAINVAFTGSGGNGWALGAFAGASGGGTLTNCYSGGTLTNTDGFSVEKFGRFGELAQVSNCYSDNDNKGDTRWPDIYSSRGSKVSTADLKGMTGDVALGAEFGLSSDGNYGYPQLLWELEKSEQSEKVSAANFEITTNGSTAEVTVRGLKNNFANSLKPLLFLISYNNGRIIDINTKEIEMEAYDYKPEVITLSADMSGADTVRAFMLKGADNVVPVLDSKEVKK